MADDGPPATFAEVLGVLREWGSAIRGDWSNDSIDGRSCRQELNYLADALELARRTDRAAGSLVRVRFEAGVCLSGGGHWPMYCSDYGCGRLR